MRRLLHLLADGDLYPVTLINRLNSWSGGPAPDKYNCSNWLQGCMRCS
jgi:hypothetical protein